MGGTAPEVVSEKAYKDAGSHSHFLIFKFLFFFKGGWLKDSL